jgi:isopenicillin N synthase-like dioxygenase
MSPIPVLEFTKYESDCTEDRFAFCAQLYAALSEYGFVKIDRHGISDSVLENVFSWVRVAYCYLSLQTARSLNINLTHRVNAFLACR